MKREFIYLKIFEKNWHELGLTSADLEELETIIMDNPVVGDIIQGTGGLRKMRFALPHRGKSGSTRVLYVDFVSYGKTLLMNIYPKNRQDNITNSEKHEYKKLIDVISKELRK